MAHPFFGNCYYVGGGNLGDPNAWSWTYHPPKIFFPTVPDGTDTVFFNVGDPSMAGALSSAYATFLSGSYGLAGDIRTGYLEIDPGVQLTFEPSLLSYGSITASLGESVSGTILQPAGTNLIPSNLFSMGGGGSYTLGGGATLIASLTAPSVWEYIGFLGTATFTQSSFSVNSAMGLQVLAGSYLMSGGQLNVGSGGIYVGVSSVGSTFTQTIVPIANANPAVPGETVSTIVDAGDFTVGYETSQASPGRFNLLGNNTAPIEAWDDGPRQLSAQNGYIGVGGFGIVNQQSGFVFFANQLSLGGNVTDNNGNLAAGSVPGNGAYMLGGTNDKLAVSHSVILGEAPGSSGTLDIFRGASTDPTQTPVNEAGLWIGWDSGAPATSFIVGEFGAGHVFQGGGVASVRTGNVIIGDGAPGDYTIDSLHAARLAVPYTNITLGAHSGGTGQLNLIQKSGTDASVYVSANSMDVGPNLAGGSQLALSGGAQGIIATRLSLYSGSSINVGDGYIEVGAAVSIGVRGLIVVGQGGTFSGAGTVTGGVEADTGSSVSVTGGSLIISGNLTGTGSVTIQNAATLEVGGSVSCNVQFHGGAGTTLRLDSATSLVGSISGFAQGDLIDLANLIVAPDNHVIWTDGTGMSNGTLYLVQGTGNAQHTLASFNLSGFHDAAEFLLAGDGHGGTVIYDQRATGKAMDGYLAGTTVFADANGNGRLDPGEVSSSTDPSGTYSFMGGSGNLVAIGGTDLLTGLVFSGWLRAPSGSAIISPFTTLLVELQNLGDSSTQAQTAILTALGLDSGIDLTTLDPVAQARVGDTMGAAALIADGKVMDTVALIVATLSSVGGVSSNLVMDAFDAVASAINAAGPGQAIDLSDIGTITGLINAVALAESLNATPVVSSAAAIIAAGNAALDQALIADGSGNSLLNDAGAIERVEQGAAAAAVLADAGNPALLAETVAGYSGAGLTAARALAQTQLAPAFSSISASVPGGLTSLGAGKVITINVNTSVAALVTGSPTLQLNDNEVATYVMGSGSRQLTFTYTVQPGDSASSLLVTGINLPAGASLQDGSGNNFPGALSGDLGLLVDATAPIVSITDNTGGIASGSVNYTLTFSKPVQGLSASDLSLTDAAQAIVGTVTSVTGSGAEYIVVARANPGVDEAVILNLLAAAVSDNLGNVNAAASAPLQRVDTVPPTVSFANNASGSATGPVTFTLTFSEAVTGLVANDFSVTNGSVTSVSGSGSGYSVVVTPASGAEGNLSLTLLAGAVTDVAGNLSAATSAAAQQIDTRPPTVAITDNVLGTANGQTTYTLTFSEPITGLTANDFTVTNGAITSVSGSGSGYTVVVTPTAGVEGTMGLALVGGAVTDLAGNPNALFAATAQPIDTKAPTAATFNPVDDIRGMAVGSNLSVTFSEPIARGTGTITLRTIDGGTAVESFNAASSTALTYSGSTLTINPTADLAYGKGYYLDIGAGSVKDIAGNSYAGSTNYNFTTNLVNPADPKSAYYEIVQKIYVAYFGRPADTGGLAFASQYLYDSHAPTDTLGFVQAYGLNAVVTGILDNFGNSAESQALYAGATSRDMVTAVYHFLLNRSPDADGLNFWANAIDAKVLTLAKVALNIMAAAETYPDADGLTVAKKIVVAQNFTTALNDHAAGAAYAGNAAALAARNMLSGVDRPTDTGDYEATLLASINTLLHPTGSAEIGLVGVSQDASILG